jgi:hypothetical protein
VDQVSSTDNNSVLKRAAADWCWLWQLWDGQRRAIQTPVGARPLFAKAKNCTAMISSYYQCSVSAGASPNANANAHPIQGDGSTPTRASFHSLPLVVFKVTGGSIQLVFCGHGKARVLIAKEHKWMLHSGTNRARSKAKASISVARWIDSHWCGGMPLPTSKEWVGIGSAYDTHTTCATVPLLLEDMHAQCCVALLGSSLLSLQSFAIAEDDTGHHDHMPPCRFRLQFIHSSQFRVHGFHLQSLYLVIWTGVDPFFKKWKISGLCIRIQPSLTKFSAQTLKNCRGERAHSNVEKPNATSILGEAGGILHAGLKYLDFTTEFSLLLQPAVNYFPS